MSQLCCGRSDQLQGLQGRIGFPEAAAADIQLLEKLIFIREYIAWRKLTADDSISDTPKDHIGNITAFTGNQVIQESQLL